MLVDWWFIYILNFYVTCNMNVLKNLMSPSRSSLPLLPPPSSITVSDYQDPTLDVGMKQ